MKSLLSETWSKVVSKFIFQENLLWELRTSLHFFLLLLDRNAAKDREDPTEETQWNRLTF